MAPPLTALRTMTKELKFRAVAQALGKGDMLACLCMAPLLWGNGYNVAKGFLVGSRHGEVHCQACRTRLANYKGL